MKIFANGLIQGLLIALLVTGFNTFFLPTRIFFISQAGLYVPSLYLMRQHLRREIPASAAWAVPAVLISLPSGGMNLWTDVPRGQPGRGNNRSPSHDIWKLVGSWMERYPLNIS